SLGCKECRAEYIKSLKDYFKQNIHLMCPTCNERLERNPLRILDCKSDICKEIASKSPDILSFICEPCSEHFDILKEQLDDAGIKYIINPRIVRGQDYYSRTVFEFVHEGAGAQGTVCGGGRYDRLVEYLGSDPCPGIGFGMGLERVLLIMEAEGIEIPVPEGPEIFIAHIGENSQKIAANLVFELQKRGIYALYDINRRGLKAQLKFADKISSKRYLVIGDLELKSGKATIRDMKTKEETTIDLNAGSIIAIL
ncbi:MAG: histidine--tRNA ligase, partial [Ruminococcaceae bacterium]|nr:histidine--tRNA ligase [Oscillospiraceae bacterium]